MDYTTSDAYVTDVTAGLRRHQDTSPVTTEVSAMDLNGLTWELMAVIAAGGLTPIAFDSANANSYKQLLKAIRVISDKVGFVSVKHPDFGAVGNGTTDDTAAINAAIAAAGPNSYIYFPPGVYKVTALLQVPNDRVTLVGAGRWASRLDFVPTVAGTMLKFSKTTAAVQFQCAIRDICLYSSETTLSKTALEVVDNSGFCLDRVVIAGARVVNGSNFWGGGTVSRGVHLKGREAGGFNNLYCYADNPLYIDKNPNSTAISIDHHNFHNMYLTAPILSAADVLAGLTSNPVITIVDGVVLSNVSFTGYQAWVGGTHGLYWNDTTSTAVSFALRIENVRTEQVSSGGTYEAFRIVHNQQLQGLRIINYYGGAEGRNGFFLRKCATVAFDGVQYTSSSLKALDVDATVKGIRGNGCLWQTGSTATLAGQRLIWGTPLNPGNSALPPDFYYDEAANSSRRYSFNGIREASAITLANNASDTTTIPATFRGVANIVERSGNGAILLHILGGGITQISQAGSIFTLTATSNKVNITWTGSAYQILNNATGASKDFSILLDGTS